MTAFDHTFRASIPGMSLAHHKLGDLPHEKPPKYVDPQEALDYFWKQFHRPEILKQIWSIFEQGGTAFAIARAILYKAALEGIIQVNLGIVIYPTVQKMLITIGKAKGIDVKIHPKLRDRTSDQMLNNKLNASMGHKHGQQIPQSALKSMIIPKADEVSEDAKKFMQATKDSSVTAGSNKGLLGLTGKE